MNPTFLRSSSLATAALVALGCSAAPVDDGALRDRDAPSVVDAGPDADADADAEVTADALPVTSLRHACAPLVTEHEIAPWIHVPRDFPVEYKTNPPSSGAHYATWVQYAPHEEAIDRREYVHNLEHGAIVLLYRCRNAVECPSLAATLDRVAREYPADPVCGPLASGYRARFVVTADPLLDVPVAVAAWGATYKADCFDEASMRAFVEAHYGRGRESSCAEGGGGKPMDTMR